MEPTLIKEQFEAYKKLVYPGNVHLMPSQERQVQMAFYGGALIAASYLLAPGTPKQKLERIEAIKQELSSWHSMVGEKAKAATKEENKETE